jgi:signal transduction histidine kinase
MRLGVQTSVVRLGATAGLVAAGCYLGASLDTLVRFPAVGAAVLFPPYAVLTTALWRTPPRAWWILLLAASAGNFLPHRLAGASVAFALLAELINHLRAVLAAAGLRRFVGRQPRVETLPQMVAYLAFAILGGPGVAALAGAWLVVWNGSGTFWLAWQEWWLSNAITGLTLLPLLALDRREPVIGRRVAEAALLAISLFTVGGWVFSQSYDRSHTHQAHLYWALPFLLWGAVRFGPRGTSATLLAVMALSVWGAVEGRGPFAAAAPTENLLELQIYLLAVSVPVLLLAALFRQQDRTAAELKRTEDERRELEARKSIEAALRDADRRKDEFLAVLGHELRNPLAPIGIALELLRQERAETGEAIWARETIGRSLGHMTRLLDDLHDISRVTLGRIPLRLELLDLRRVVATSLEVTRPLIDSFGHELTVRLPEQPQPIRGDSVRLAQIVCNLLNNAAKYTEPGGRIEVALEREGPGVRLSVRDNGIGMAADALTRIFEPFSQLPTGRERERGGLGIGLTLVKRLVELHGGAVEARSAGPRLGSELIVRLPLSADQVLDPTPPPAAVPGRCPSLRILAVDDNADIALGLANVLGTWGHTVRTAHDGATALALAGTFAPEVVLVDLGLPRVDGLEVARRLRQSHARPPALMVSMSGFGHDQTRARSGEAGFHHHLPKPVDLESLRVLLEQLPVAREG